MPVCPFCRQSAEPDLAAYCCVLQKSLHDDFHYVVGLTSGLVITFRSAEARGDLWLHLYRLDDPTPVGPPWQAFECPRGVDVRIADIVWAADAPLGS